mgnify:CR=1 FL=1
MAYEYQLQRALLKDYNGEKKTKYLFTVNDRIFGFTRHTCVKTGYSRYNITDHKSALILSWNDDDDYTYIDISGEDLEMLESLLAEKFGIVIPKLS